MVKASDVRSVYYLVTANIFKIIYLYDFFLLLTQVSILLKISVTI